MTVTLNSVDVVHNYVKLVEIDPSATLPQQGYLDPIKLSTAYSMPASTGANVKVGIVSLGGGYLLSDLQKSMTALGLPTPSVTQHLIDGATGTFSLSDNDASLENTLDLYCISGIVPNADIHIYIGNAASSNIQVSSNPADAADLNKNNYFANVVNAAVNDGCDVITISWGSPEYVMSGNTKLYVGDYMATAFANAIAQGTTVLVASGDYGSQPTKTVPYVEPQYPASNSNVLGIGGTYLQLHANNTRFIEEAYKFSGGGISSMISLPEYQTGLAYTTYNSVTGLKGPTRPLGTRGVPDMAAAMNTYAFYYNGVITGGAGTSASCPILAGLIARYNSLLGRRLGKLHSTLYQNRLVFDDMTSGYDTSALTTGYAGSAGWDPITGQGVPNGTKLYNILPQTKVKVDGTWVNVIKAYVKTDSSTWTEVQKVYTKSTSTTWTQTL